MRITAREAKDVRPATATVIRQGARVADNVAAGEGGRGGEGVDGSTCVCVFFFSLKFCLCLCFRFVCVLVFF